MEVDFCLAELTFDVCNTQHFFAAMTTFNVVAVHFYAPEENQGRYALSP
jgi:hypothetical protein